MKEYGTVFKRSGAAHLFDYETNKSLCGRFGGMHSGYTYRFNGRWEVEKAFGVDGVGAGPRLFWVEANELDISQLCKHCKAIAARLVYII